jgi:hypothetical protein
MASAKKSTSNRVKPTSSAAKVRMADTKMTKAANAKAPRYPQGQQGYGMSNSKASIRTMDKNWKYNNVGQTTIVTEKNTGKDGKDLQKLRKAAKNANASGLKGKKNIALR